MFIPYRARIKITRVPTMTLIVAVVCLLVYWAQARNEARILESAKAFCTEDIVRDLQHAQKRAFPASNLTCDEILAHIYLETRPEAHLAWHRTKLEAAGDRESADTLERHYRAFAARAPRYLTERLWHYSGGWNLLRLLSATLAHGSWDHVIGNLFFFVAFGMVVETVIGPALFLLVFLGLGLGSGALQNLLTTSREGGAGLGLSGVVMGVMTLAAYFAPKVKIKFFYFYFLFFGVLSWPLWSVAAWYVFWNLWDYYFWRDFIPIGFAAHLAGAAMGLILGLALFRNKRHWVQQQLLPDEPSLKDDESWLYKFNALGATPVVMYFVFIYGLAALVLGTYLFVTFIQTFAAQLLLAAPAIAGLVQIWRLKQPKKPDRLRIDEGLRLLADHRFGDAERILKPLAEANDARAQHALATLYSSATGAMRNEPEALRWFRAAAERGLPAAQYALGVRHLHGMGVAKNLDEAIAWLEKAATKGAPEAAATLGHIYENGPKPPADNEKAIEWYYKAGVGYHKAGQHKDAAAMIKILQHLAAKYPAVVQLIGELERLLAAGEARQ